MLTVGMKSPDESRGFFCFRHCEDGFADEAIFFFLVVPFLKKHFLSLFFTRKVTKRIVLSIAPRERTGSAQIQPLDFKGCFN